MRYSNTPVLFTCRGDDWVSDRVLACINVASSDTEHDRLNHVIVNHARTMGDILGLGLHVAACFRDRIMLRPEIVANRYDVQPDQVHLREGPINDSLQKVCLELDP